MDLDDQGAFLEAHSPRRVGVENLIDNVDLDEVVARSQRAKLGPSMQPCSSVASRSPSCV
jgi:hypothetical protein